jgi:hypothetical protein
LDQIDLELGNTRYIINFDERSNAGELRTTLSLRYHFGKRNRNRPR